MVLCRNCLTAGTGLTTEDKILIDTIYFVSSQLPYGGNGSYDWEASRLLKLLRVLSQLPYGGNGSYDTVESDSYASAVEVAIALRRERVLRRKECGANPQHVGGRNCLTAGTGLTTKEDFDGEPLDDDESQLPYGGNGSYDGGSLPVEP